MKRLSNSEKAVFNIAATFSTQETPARMRTCNMEAYEINTKKAVDRTNKKVNTKNMWTAIAVEVGTAYATRLSPSMEKAHSNATRLEPC